MPVKIAPSFLSADFTNLKDEIEMINQSEADWFHLDVMDGVFVPNISFGFPVIKHIKRLSKKPLDVHLMIVDPDRYINQFRDAGADILTVHFEACNHLHRTVDAIQKAGMKAGVAINPHTPVSFLKEIMLTTDMILVMSVNPGFGGQKFIPNSIKKVERLDEYRMIEKLNFMIEVDGGVDNSNAEQLIKAGTDVLVAGSYVFNSSSPHETIKSLKK